MGFSLLRSPVEVISAPRQLTRPGILAGFLAGFLVILGNPKASLFYIGILLGFFTVDRLKPIDITIIGGLSALVPFLGNLVMGLLVDHVSKTLNSLPLRRRINRITGGVLILVGAIIFVG